MTSDDILHAAKWRRAIKEFRRDRIITETDFKALLEVARLSPTSLGLEPWNIILIKDQSVRDAIKPHCTGGQRQLDSASHFVVFTVKTDLGPGSDYFRMIKKDIYGLNEAEYHDFVSKCAMFQESKQDLTDFRKRVDWAGKQAYIALGVMMLTAALLGIDSCPIEGFVPKHVESVLEEHELLDPKMDHVVVMAAFGYRAGDPANPQRRRSLGQVVKVI